MASAESSSRSIEDIASELYEKCSKRFSADDLMYQDDLFSLGVIASLDVLLQCTQSLVDRNLFRVLEDKGSRLAWKLISQEDAERMQSLNDNETIVYNVIHSTGRNGIWIRPLAARTGLHKTNLDKALKALEGKHFIKSIHNVKISGRKVYMLAGLMPAEDVTGGAWFTDGVLDAEFIGVLSEYIEHFVSKRSWYAVPVSHKHLGKGQKLNNAEPVKSASDSKQYIPYPAGYKYYPTITDITNEVNKTGITPLKLNEGNIAQLLQTLCFDNKLIALNESQNFKAVRKPDGTSLAWKKREEADKLPTTAKIEAWIGRNGMTEAPCGQCPVFKLCQPGGAVNPDNCEYFDTWLEQTLGF